MEAADAGNVEMLRVLLSNGADVNAQSTIGSTAFHMAQYGGRNRAEIERILKEAGAKK